MKKNRLKVDQRKSDATVKMERPTDVSAVQIFIGLVKYLSKFLQNLSEMWEPLYRLICKNADWIWTYGHKDAFEKINNTFSKAPVLKHFSESDVVEGQGDASKDGFDFLLMQNSKLVKSASHESPPTRERKYYQSEK